MVSRQQQVVRRMGRTIRPRRSRRRRFRRHANNIADLAYRAYKGYKMIRGIVNSEMHYTDVQIVSGVQTSTGSVTLINQVAQGDDITTRTGSSILCKYIVVKYSIVMSAAATATTVRIGVVIDNNNQGTAPAFSDIWETGDMTSFKTINNQKRFVMLRDQTFDMSINGQQNYTGTWYIPINQHLRYNGTGASQVLSPSLWMTLDSTEATNAPALTIRARTAFYDN